ncbi:MAG: S8 family peptidase, partial [Thermoplasmatales archaeon]|nr:S8 family peptidase [Thermoplasmatales archaeon]
IVQFNDEPILKFKTRFIEKIKSFFTHLTEKAAEVFLNSNVQEHQDKILSIHKKAKEDITDIVGNYDSFGEFFDLFNGICIKNIQRDDIEEIKDLPYVKNVIPNYIISVNLDESVPMVEADKIWNYHDINGNSLTGEGIKIAIVDTGINYNHPDLEGRYLGGYDYVNNDDDPMDDHGHGTHCASIALGSGEYSNYKYVGVAPMASYYSYKAIGSNGKGSSVWLLAALEQAVDDDVNIISLSLGDNNSSANPDDILSQAADTAVDAGVIVVAAAGNGGEDGPINSPGCARKVICVGASDGDDIAGFSSRGPVEWGDDNYLEKPDVVAPGVNIVGASKNRGYVSRSGTSMATPHVAGAVALMLQANPDLNSSEIKLMLMENATDLGFDNNTQGQGRINVSASVEINNEIIIKSPYRVTEENDYSISIADNEGNPVKAVILVWTPMHLPRLKYGSSVSVKAPIIINPLKSSLESKIHIFNFKKGLKKQITILVTSKN